jgi:hypothetical protein
MSDLGLPLTRVCNIVTIPNARIISVEFWRFNPVWSSNLQGCELLSRYHTIKLVHTMSTALSTFLRIMQPFLLINLPLSPCHRLWGGQLPV